jgi:hypothetical protein
MGSQCNAVCALLYCSFHINFPEREICTKNAEHEFIISLR